MYEAQVNTHDQNMAVDSNEADEEDEARSRRMKGSLVDEMDDYELQEKLMMNLQYDNANTTTAKKSDRQLKQARQRDFEKEDEANESNV